MNRINSKLTYESCWKILSSGNFSKLISESKRKLFPPQFNWGYLLDENFPSFFQNKDKIKILNKYDDCCDLMDYLFEKDEVSLKYKILFSILYEEMGEIPEFLEELKINLNDLKIETYLKNKDELSFYENRIKNLV